VTNSPDGARRVYRLDLRGILAMRAWIDAKGNSALR
jgi:hypothetical protein